jgi:hypothetical protein
MTDNELFQLMIPILNAGFTADGYSDITVMQAYNPTQQGAIYTSSVYLSKMYDYRYGWFARYQNYTNPEIACTQIQQVETTFKVSTWVIQDPLVTNSYTAADLAEEAALIIASIDTIQQLAAVKVGMLRIIDISNDYEFDDRDQFEATPGFKFTLLHSKTRNITVPQVQFIESDIERV